VTVTSLIRIKKFIRINFEKYIAKTEKAYASNLE